MQRRSRGQSIVELALVLPIFFMLTLGALDVGRAVFLQSLLSNAARDGARYGIVAPTDSAGIQSHATVSTGPFANGIQVCSAVVYSLTLLSSAPACSNAGLSAETYGYVTVVATMPFQLATALFAPQWTLTLSAQSTMLFQP